MYKLDQDGSKPNRYDQPLLFSPFREYMCDLELEKKVLEDSQTKQVLQYYNNILFHHLNVSLSQINY